MSQRSRTDLCGGCRATGIPTATLQRRHGLNRCRYRGDEGMQRWVGLGVIADNLINIGRHLAACDSR